MVLILLLSLYLAIAAAFKKRYSLVLLAVTSMSVAVLSFIRKSSYFVQVSGAASIASNIVLIAFSAITIFVLCKKE